MISRRKFLTFPLIGAAAFMLPSVLTACNGSDDSVHDESETGDDSSKYVQLTTFLFDTVIEIKAQCTQETLDAVEQRLIFFENTLSKTIEGSDIYRVNHAGGAPVTVQPETAELVEMALHYSEISDGLFDITIGGVIALWDFVNEVMPEPDELEEALSHVDYRKVHVDGLTITLDDPLAQLDLGGIAKGYIADAAAQVLREAGCTSAFINLGGNVFALGSKDDGSAWRVGLQDPNGVRGSVIGAVPARERSVVTSGINERSFIRDGVVYHHLLDPKTGMPAQNGLASATIVSDLSVDGDAFTTITFLMGETEAKIFLESYPDFDWVFIDTEGGISSTPSLELELL